MHEQTAIAWLEEKKRKYLYGLDRQTTIVHARFCSISDLCISLTADGVSSDNHFADYFGDHALWELFPYYYWFLTSAVTLLLLPALAAKVGTKCREFATTAFAYPKESWVGGWLSVFVRS